MNQSFRFRRTTLISLCLAAFLAGLVISKWQGIWIASDWLVLGLPFIFVLRRKKLASLVAVLVIGGLVGLWRGGDMLARVGAYDQFMGQEVAITGTVRNDPIYDDRGQMDFRLGGVQVGDRSMPGEVRVRGFVNDVRRGDAVVAKGRLQSGFGNYQAAVSFAQVEVIERSGSWIESVRRDFFASVYSVLPEPHASLGLGFLVGLRSALPEDFDDQLRVAGLTHIVVASGYNLTILVRMSRRLFEKRSKYQAFISSVALVAAFLAVTGMSPSITRASVVTLLSLCAWYFGRRIHPVLIILLGAALTAGMNPLYIWYDLGWWLSFLAFSGVLLLAPLITKRIFGDESPKLLAQVAIETVSAQLMAVPLIMFVFGDLSLVALLANMLVVPLIPFAMITTFIAGMAGMMSVTIGAWLAIPAQFILNYMINITRLLSRPSWAQQSIALSAVGMVMLYVSVFMVGLGLRKRTGFKLHEVPSAVE